MTQPAFDLFEPLKRTMTAQQASEWATAELGRYFASANITDLVENGYIPGVQMDGTVLVFTEDVKRYYRDREDVYTKVYGESRNEDVDWYLTFNHLNEAETTKHVHRLNPYKGKFIPQLG